MTLWGVILACTALATNFAQVAALRFLLGLFEAGIYPAMTLLVSTCYRRSEQAARLGKISLYNFFIEILLVYVKKKFRLFFNNLLIVMK